jgi:endonuclease YncB( thermonuclease family)
MLVVGLTLGGASQLHVLDGATARIDRADTAVESLAPASLRVIDGDTFEHDGERIRIADIDTPELRGQCAEEQRLARAATARLRVLLAQGDFELRRLGRDEDRYGRKLRIVVRHGRSLGDTLVAEGLARTWTGRREPWC